MLAKGYRWTFFPATRPSALQILCIAVSYLVADLEQRSVSGLDDEYTGQSLLTTPPVRGNRLRFRVTEPRWQHTP